MQENKYYKPEIEEFHRGFEYEHFIEKSNRWSKEIFHMNQSHIDIIKYILIDELPKVRVKYLDKEDIESFGFKYQKHGTYYKGDLIRMQHDTDRNMVAIEYYKNGRYQIGMQYVIKNKSEFQSLMKFLNIKKEEV